MTEKVEEDEPTYKDFNDYLEKVVFKSSKAEEPPPPDDEPEGGEIWKERLLRASRDVL